MTKTVLFVDDDRQMLLALKQGLSRWADSFGVLMAENGIDALERLRSREVSLVVTDLKMPQMDGLELLAAIMQNYPGIPVMVMTGFSTPDRERSARQGGAVDFITKPFSVDHLARRMIVMLNQQSEGGTLHNVSCATFLQLIEMEQKTCTIRLEERLSGKKGILFFVQGELFDARVGDLQGLDAAHELLAWDQVSLSLQYNGLVRQNRIRKNLSSLILEAARRKDENAPPAASADLPRAVETPLPDSAESPAFIRARVEKALGVDCGVQDVFQDLSSRERVSRISRIGERLKLGKLKLAYVNWGDSREYLIRPSEPPMVIAVDPKCPREKLMQLLCG